MNILPVHKKINRNSILLKAVSILLIALIGFLMAGDSTLNEKLLSIRMMLYLGSGLVAFAIPYILFPDRNITIYQLGNSSPDELRNHIWKRCKTIWLMILWLLFVVVFTDIRSPFGQLTDKVLIFIYGTSFFTGLLYYSISRYFQIGRHSQEWQEGKKGAEIRKKMADLAKFPLDPGSIPSLLNTIVITAGGMLLVVTGAFVSGNFGITGETAVGLIILTGGYISWKMTNREADVHFYATNAFYREFFGTDIKGDEQFQPLAVNQLWWVPPVIRVHVWALITQLDRKLPTGRIIAIGHFIVWIVAYQRPGEDVLTGAWVLFIIAHSILLLPTSDRAIMPQWWQQLLDKPAVWMSVRFWMQLRWILPLLLSCNVMYLFFGTPDFGLQAWFVLLYLAVHLVISALITYRMHTTVESVYE